MMGSSSTPCVGWWTLGQQLPVSCDTGLHGQVSVVLSHLWHASCPHPVTMLSESCSQCQKCLVSRKVTMRRVCSRMCRPWFRQACWCLCILRRSYDETPLRVRTMTDGEETAETCKVYVVQSQWTLLGQWADCEDCPAAERGTAVMWSGAWPPASDALTAPLARALPLCSPHVVTW